MFPKVYIIILNWNGKDDTIECLSSIEKIDYPNYEIILLDNGSSDDSVAMFKEKYSENKKIKLIENKENLGFTGGNNIGIKYALDKGTDYILLLNNDTVVKSDFLTELIKFSEKDKAIGITGPKIYQYGTDDVMDSAGTKTIPFWGQPFLRGHNEKDTGIYNHIEDVDYITGCALLIKTEVIKKIGLLDEDYFAYFEDWDWNIRAKKAGYRTVYIPKAIIWHKSSSTSVFKSPFYCYYMTRNRILFAIKNVNIVKRLFLFYPYFFLYRFLIPLIRLSFQGDLDSIKSVIRGIIWHFRN